jgi:hypothetical protein
MTVITIGDGSIPATGIAFHSPSPGFFVSSTGGGIGGGGNVTFGGSDAADATAEADGIAELASATDLEVELVVVPTGA